MNTLQKAWTWVGQWRMPQPLGKRGEVAAARFLKRLGFLIVARSERDMLGEMDLIAVDQRTVVFVEVKTRSSDAVQADLIFDPFHRRNVRIQDVRCGTQANVAQNASVTCRSFPENTDRPDRWSQMSD